MGDLSRGVSAGVRQAAAEPETHLQGKGRRSGEEGPQANLTQRAQRGKQLPEPAEQLIIQGATPYTFIPRLIS